MSSRAVARQILQFRDLLPECVKSVHVKGDGEFIGWDSILACRKQGHTFTFGKGRATPVFPEEGWYRRGKLEYNECRYQPFGWGEACRFVASRERKKKALPGLCGDFLLGEMDGEARGWEPGTALECGNPRTRDSGWPLGIALAEQGSCHSKRI